MGGRSLRFFMVRSYAMATAYDALRLDFKEGGADGKEYKRATQSKSEGGVGLELQWQEIKVVPCRGAFCAVPST